jgi:hypothetical protein
MHNKELESNIDKRHEEIESYLKNEKKVFELEKRRELQHIASLRRKKSKKRVRTSCFRYKET